MKPTRGLVLILVVASACKSEQKATRPKATADATPSAPAPVVDPATGAGLIANNCLGCHQRELLEQQRLTPKQWAAVVKKMAGWGSQIEPTNVDALVAYLGSHYQSQAAPYSARLVEAQAVEDALRPLPDGPFAKGDARRGSELWVKACATCHGADARGTMMGTNLVDQPLLLRAAEFAQVTRKGQGRMPAFDLADGEIGSLLAWLRTVRP